MNKQERFEKIHQQLCVLNATRGETRAVLSQIRDEIQLQRFLLFTATAAIAVPLWCIAWKLS